MWGTNWWRYLPAQRTADQNRGGFFSADSADWDGAVDRIFAGFDSAVLSQDEGEEVVPGLLGGWGGDRDSVCRGEL